MSFKRDLESLEKMIDNTNDRLGEVKNLLDAASMQEEVKKMTDKVEKLREDQARNMKTIEWQHRQMRREELMRALEKREFFLQAVWDEVHGREPEPDPMVEHYKSLVMDLQWALAERGPKIEELLSNPLAREAFSPAAMNTMFGALDPQPRYIKPQILADILRLETAQTETGDTERGSEVEATKASRALLEAWGPIKAREYWDMVVAHPEQFFPISQDQLARFRHLLGGDEHVTV